MLNVVDATLTCLGVAIAGPDAELNPLMRSALQWGLEPFWLFKVGTGTLLCVIIAHRRPSQRTLWALAAVCGIYLGTAINNGLAIASAWGQR